MQKLIDIINKELKEVIDPGMRFEYIRLLLKIESIKLLSPHVEKGMGFAIEGVSRIASSEASKLSDVTNILNELKRILIIDKQEQKG